MKKKDSVRHNGLFDAGFLDEHGINELVPDSLARWRPLVAEGLAFFLQRLDPSRLLTIALAQAALPEQASAARRLVSLLAECPTLHKLGQVLARHRALPIELRLQLQTLETLPATTPLDDIRAILFGELRELPSDLKLADKALAEGSVAVVLPFSYQEDGGRRPGGRREGVFKVLKPNVERHFAEEMAIWLELAEFMKTRGAELGLPPLDYRDTLEGIRELLAKEVDLTVEQQNLQEAASLYAAEPRVLIPRLLPWCSPRVTAMERVFGTKLSDAELSPKQRHALADTLIETLLGQPFWNPADDTLVHADLHGGNLFLADDGRVAVLDWSLTTRIAKRHREAMVSIALGGLTLDADRICRSIAELGVLPADNPDLGAAVEQALNRGVLRGELPGFNWVLDLLDDIATRTPCGFPHDLLVFRKTWFSLAGVIRDIGGEPAPDIPLLGIAAKRFLGEYLARFLEWPDSRRFATHLSNTDLVGLVASPMLTVGRYWGRLFAGLLGGERDRVGAVE